MNNEKKIVATKNILDAYLEKLCPYCRTPTIEYVDKKGVRVMSCENHDSILIIDLEDYMNAINNVINYSVSLEEPNKFKDIMGFLDGS